MIGLCFHAIKEGALHWQGKLVRLIPPASFEVVLYSWLTGEPNGTRIVPIGDMADWRFYLTNEEMNDAYEDES